MKKIAILGTTPSRKEAPIDDPEWEIWTVGPGGKDSHRWERLFEIHTTWPEDFKDYLNELSKSKEKIYTVVPMKEQIQTWAQGHGKDEKWLKKTIKGDWSSNVVINRESLFEKYRRMWFSSSISYCVALAIEEGATDIGCFGIDLESGEEYISQYAGCAYFLDLARLSGINLHIPNGSGLLRDLSPYPDRYETHLALTFEKKKKWLNDLLSRAEPENEAVKRELYRTEGVVMAMRELTAPPERIADAEKRLLEFNQHMANSNANVNHLKGERAATEYYQRMYVWGMTEPNE